MNLYIDFDGVILDTIPILEQILIDSKIDNENEPEKRKLFAAVDWENMVRTTPQINDSIECIEKLRKSNKFNIAILTHINSLQEAVAKINFLEEKLPDITKIVVPKEVSKTKMLETKNSILVDDYGKNLEEWESEGGIPIKFSTNIEKIYKYKSISRLDQLLDIF